MFSISLYSVHIIEGNIIFIADCSSWVNNWDQWKVCRYPQCRFLLFTSKIDFVYEVLKISVDSMCRLIIDISFFAELHVRCSITWRIQHLSRIWTNDSSWIFFSSNMWFDFHNYCDGKKYAMLLKFILFLLFMKSKTWLLQTTQFVVGGFLDLLIIELQWRIYSTQKQLYSKG